MYLKDVGSDPNEIKNHVLHYCDTLKKNKLSKYNIMLGLCNFSEKRVLDYGCGFGYYSIALHNKGNTVTGIDISKDAIDICKFVWGTRDGLAFENKNISKYPDNSFEYVISSQVIEHVFNTGTYLSELNRVLCPNGKLIISLPNVMTVKNITLLLLGNVFKRLKKLNSKILKNYDQGNDHIHSWDPFHFVTLAGSTGFRLEKYIPAGGLTFLGKDGRNKYIHINIGNIKNYSHQMIFVFKKEFYNKIDYNQ